MLPRVVGLRLENAMSRIIRLRLGWILASVIIYPGWDDETVQKPMSMPTVISRLNHCIVGVGEKVVLTESIPKLASPPDLRRVEHRAYRLRLSATSNSRDTVSILGVELEKVVNGAAFQGLPMTLKATHGFRMESISQSEKGLLFSIVPRAGGVYLIVSSWRFEDREEETDANPVILIVR
jgi:hypothetical protein